MRRLLTLLMLGLTGLPLAAADLIQDWQRAIQDNRLEVIRRHLDEIKDVNLATERGKTALMAAASQGAADLVRALLERGAAVNALNHNAGTALIYAAWSGDVQTARMLLDRGAAVNQQSSNGWSALMMAAAKDHALLAGLLLERGAAVGLPDIYGWTPLMRATYAGHQDVVSVLLAHPGIAIDAANDQGQTALHLAVIQQNVPIARQLLAHGARPDSRDVAGRTPRSIVLELGHQQLLALLPGEQTPPK